MDRPVSERELAWRLRELLHAHGADELSFDSIVASGANGAQPHAIPTDKIVERGTLVIVDWGVRVDGYCSDCTRTFSTGGVPARLREAYDVCLEAQQQACAGIQAGLTGIEADALARDPITAAGFGENFGHGLGHGVGIAVHEAPRLSTESTDTLEAGHVVTIEPGIYLPGLGGVRIEDLAIVRDDGVELLTSFPKELIEVGSGWQDVVSTSERPCQSTHRPGLQFGLLIALFDPRARRRARRRQGFVASHLVDDEPGPGRRRGGEQPRHLVALGERLAGRDADDEVRARQQRDALVERVDVARAEHGEQSR